MAENFENLDNILRNWASNKVQKSLGEALNRYEKQKEERKKTFFFFFLFFFLRKSHRKILEQSQSAVERD